MTRLSLNQFPEKNDLARNLFEEGIRHLEDASVLHKAQRHAATIASAMKAAELGIKTMIVVANALGWWDKVFSTHSPLTDIKSLPTFRSLIIMLEGYEDNKTLIRDVVELESLAPTRPGGNYDLNSQKNPEYPFLSFDPTAGTGGFLLDKPSTYFTNADSARYYNIAQDLLNAVATKDGEVGQWKLTLPGKL